MSQANAAIVQQRQSRADLALADLAANGGLLLPEQANQFIDFILEAPTILRQVRQVRMAAPSMKINRMGFGSRILRSARQTGGALDAGGNDRYVRAADRAKPQTSQIELNTSEVIAEVRIPYEVLEDNIEGMSMEEHIMRQIAQRVAVDLEEFGLWADTSLAGTDPFLGLQNGWMKRANAHLYDNNSAGISAAMFGNALLQLPQKYLRDLDNMKAFVTEKARIQYMQFLQSRGTALGDAAVQGNIPLKASGITVEAAPMLAVGPVSAATQNGLITNPKNLLWGIQREITLETDRDIRSREHIIVVTARVALQIDDVQATVRIDELGEMGDVSLPVKVVNTTTAPVNTKEVP